MGLTIRCKSNYTLPSKKAGAELLIKSITSFIEVISSSKTYDFLYQQLYLAKQMCLAMQAKFVKIHYGIAKVGKTHFLVASEEFPAKRSFIFSL